MKTVKVGTRVKLSSPAAEAGEWLGTVVRTTADGEIAVRWDGPTYRYAHDMLTPVKETP